MTTQAGEFLRVKVRSPDMRVGELKRELHALGLGFQYFIDSC